jgi:hypothetical protein
MELTSDTHVPITYMISQRGLSCERVARHLCAAGIPGSVTKQKTVFCDKSRANCVIENGCSLTIYNTPIHTFREKVVEPLRATLSLKCGYVRIDGVYVGCAQNLFRSSECNSQ